MYKRHEKIEVGSHNVEFKTCALKCDALMRKCDALKRHEKIDIGSNNVAFQT